MNKHVKMHVKMHVKVAEVVKNPGDYVGRHRLDSALGGKQICMFCPICLSDLKVGS